MATLLNLERLNARELQKFPLAESATEKSGQTTLPRDVLLDFTLPVPADVALDRTQFRLGTITIYGGGLLLEIEHATAGLVASLSVDSSHPAYGSAAVVGRGALAGVVGAATLGEIFDRSGRVPLPPGRYSFDAAGGLMDPAAFPAQVRHVRSITVARDAERSSPLDGLLRLVAGRNVQLTVSTVSGVKEVRIDGIDASGFAEDCPCEGATPPPCVRSVNGVPPDATGNIQINTPADGCLAVTSGADGLLFDDTCAKPCCGPTELLSLTAEIDRLRDNVGSMAITVGRLESVTDTDRSVILASQTSEYACP